MATVAMQSAIARAHTALERGRGIRSIAITTIAGTETLSRVDDALCADRES